MEQVYFAASLFIAGISIGVLVTFVGQNVQNRSRRPHRQDGVADEEQPLLRPPLSTETSSSSTIFSLLQELDPLKLEIRLIRLHAGCRESKLEASLQIQSLIPDVEPPTYEALSYVWADISGTGRLYVDDVQHEITANLAEALFHLRYADRDRLLWVDALCINQNHSVERGQQVRLMKTVYSRAARVIIWLGPETQDSAQALQDLESLSHDKHFKDMDFYGKVDDDGKTWLPAPAERIKPLENLLGRTYWSRIWVVQEIVRAKQATMVCGSSSIDWQTCVKARDNWPKHSRTCCNTTCNIMHGRTRRVMNWINSSWRKYRDTNGDLVSQLNLTRSLNSTDPRDKIFGALGLVDDEKSIIDPDYDSDFETVFRDWAANLIRTKKGLDVLLHTNYSLRHPTVASWVPDWTQVNSSARFEAERSEHHQHIYRSFSADGCTWLASAFFTSGNLLRLAGLPFDVVARVGDRLGYNRQDNLTDEQNQIGAIHKWNSTLESWAQILESTNKANRLYPGAGGTYDDAYWRTLVSDHITEVGTFLGDRIRAHDKRHYDLWRQWFTELVKQPDEKKNAYYKDCLAEDRDLDRLDWTIINMNYNRRLFSTRDGRLGMGPADMQPNDHVVLLSGGRTPFVVRLSEPQSPTSSGAYLLIGYAYVQGVMDGEIAPLNGHWKDVWFC